MKYMVKDEGRTAAIVFGIAVPLFAAVMYVLLGAPQIMTPQAAKVGKVSVGITREAPTATSRPCRIASGGGGFPGTATSSTARLILNCGSDT